MKRYKAVFFDWDGTAVYSRTAPADDVIAAMGPLLHKGISLAVISGTTMENIAGGRLPEAFSVSQRQHLFFGLARGAINLRFDEAGAPCEFSSGIPSKADLLKLHEACFQLHQWLLCEYGLPSDITFSRPNYCKLDLMTASSRGEQLYLQGDEIERLHVHLHRHGIRGGVRALIRRAEGIGQAFGLSLCATSDAKYLELGFTLKSHNVNAIFSHLHGQKGLMATDCCFWGDEYVRVGDGSFGSDSFMQTPLTRPGDFFDVSTVTGERPQGVTVIGGGVEQFLSALKALDEAI